MRAVLDAERVGDESWEMYCFIHGLPTRNVGTWLPGREEPGCGNNRCAKLRDETDHMLEILETNEVPVLVLSAGVGDLINHIMEHFGVLHSNTTLVSNFLKFDEEGNIVGLQGEESDLIHMYNKAESIRKRSKETSERKNVIVLGDSLGDLHMAAGVKDPNVVLTIGFLNNNVESSLETYKENFDIVLVDDQTMSFPNSLLAEILSSTD